MRRRVRCRRLLRVLILARGREQEVARHGGDVAVHCLLARGRRKEKKRRFSNNPLYLFVNTDSFKAETLVIYLEHFRSFKNSEKIYVGF